MPSDLEAQFGEIEHAFSPNVRNRRLATLIGLMLTALGVTLLILKVGDLMPGGWGENKFIAFMLVLGGAIIVGARLLPMDWVFVCSRGLVRTRGSAWEGIEWSDIDRFEDASMTHRGIAIRQCRLMLKDGSEWGFIADNFAEYGRMTEMLRQKTGAKAV
jgi:hypothetical protein